jgi:3-dehydrosphinganine reductase
VKNFENKLVLITGGSMGIGLALAKQFSKMGANVWILSRHQENLDNALKLIEAERINSSQVFGSIAADVSDHEQLSQEIKNFHKKAGTPNILINCAGYSYPETFLNIPLEVFRQQMEINYFGTINSIYAILPFMLARGSGHIVNISSMGGYLSFYGFSAYSASKFAVRGFSDALRSELKLKGIHVSVVFPPDTDTPGLQKENEIKPQITRDVSGAGSLASPESVAREIIQGIQHNRYLILPGLENKFFYHLMNVLGGWTYPIIDILVGRAYSKGLENKFLFRLGNTLFGWFFQLIDDLRSRKIRRRLKNTPSNER